MVSKSEIRESVLGRFRSFIYGPIAGENEFIEGARGLTLQYLTGILFPKSETKENLGLDGFDEKSSADGAEEFAADADNPLSLANERLPSSVGLSFVLQENAVFSVFVKAGSYTECFRSSTPDCAAVKNQEPDFCWADTKAGSCSRCGSKPKLERGFKRRSLNETLDGLPVKPQKVELFNGKATLRVDVRPDYRVSTQKVVTVSLVNEQEVSTKPDRKPDAERRRAVEKRLFQVELLASTSERFLPYEDARSQSKLLDEQILALQNSEKSVLAVGHGCSAGWDEKKPNLVWIDYLPTELVNRPLFDQLIAKKPFEETDVFRFEFLADEDNRPAVLQGLGRLIDHYSEWVEIQEALPDNGLIEAKDHLVEKMRVAISRMRKGLQLLSSEPEVFSGFRLANKAMLLQRLQVTGLKRLRADREEIGAPWPIPSSEQIMPTIESDRLDLKVPTQNKWRPFQLAFFLTSFAGLEDQHQDEREIADLIWFSTGGGKTEAYLLMAAFEMIRRRMRFGDAKGGGTAVLTRYTLRFLTTDQFSRIASLMVALEKVRAEFPTMLGKEEFSVGLLVGGSSTYNSTSHVSDGPSLPRDLEQLFSSREIEHKLPITECPNCGTDLLPPVGSDPEKDNHLMGPTISGSRLTIKCTNRACRFNCEEGLPVRVTDDDVIKRAKSPTFVLGTVDKLANLPMNPKMVSVFGYQPDSGRVVSFPPSLIIQDELHLISGPLGTITAIYEAGIDVLIRCANQQLSGKYVGPKYIAASATVRDAATQVRRLTGRSTEVFPPQGISASDSYFARDDDKESTARKYVGVMSQGLSSTSAAHWVLGAALQSVRREAREHGTKSDFDFLWTLLGYSNSKRELSLINGATNDEILARMRVCESASMGDESYVTELEKIEVSSDAVRNIAAVRGALLNSVSDTGHSLVRDFVPCTNMISVGVDIDRLGMMVINGQPKTTAEYIQASSRVGRDPIDQGPGLVVTLFSPSKPRDRSHYEHFKAFHQALYRQVEPNSITPGSIPALNRCLHAAVAMVIRYTVSGRISEEQAKKYDPDAAEDKQALKLIEDRLVAGYPDQEFEQSNIRQKLNEFSEDWKLLARTTELHYSHQFGQQKPHLTYLLPKQPTSRKSGPIAMTSMRGVDAEIGVTVDG